MKYVILIYSLFFIPLLTFPQTGIVYKPCPEALTVKAKEVFQSEIISPKYILFDKTLYIGPVLWNRLKKDSTINKIEGGNLELLTPFYDDKGSLVEQKIIQGKLIQNKDDFKIVWDYIIKELSESPILYRKLTQKELSYYWSVIFYDIEEPIYIVENRNIKLLIDQGNSLKLLWLDEVK